jgi:hypothetical protein
MSEPLHFGSGSDETPNIVSDGFIEAMWEMLIALGTAVAICIGVISLAAHVSEAQKARGIAENGTRAGDRGSRLRLTTFRDPATFLRRRPTLHRVQRPRHIRAVDEPSFDYFSGFCS